MTRVQWIAEAADELTVNFGLDKAQAKRLAEKLYDRDATKERYAESGGLSASDHMRSDEPALVNPTSRECR